MVKTKGKVRQIISKYIEALTKHVKIEKVILFGSYAKGNPKPYSDIDLAVISPNFGQDRLNDMFLLSHLCRYADFDIEAIPFSITEFENVKQGTFLYNIIQHGILVYRGDNGKACWTRIDFGKRKIVKTF